MSLDIHDCMMYFERKKNLLLFNFLNFFYSWTPEKKIVKKKYSI